jgi:prepilin-type N-terminal cleavage/methylation domain-containing protein
VSGAVRDLATIPMHRSGVTLVELVVALTVLGVAAGVAGLTLRAARSADPVSPAAARVAEARREALASGRPVSIDVVVGGAAASATAMPDGSVVGDSVLAVDRLTGRAVSARP